MGKWKRVERGWQRVREQGGDESAAATAEEAAAISHVFRRVGRPVRGLLSEGAATVPCVPSSFDPGVLDRSAACTCGLLSLSLSFSL